MRNISAKEMQEKRDELLRQAAELQDNIKRIERENSEEAKEQRRVDAEKKYFKNKFKVSDMKMVSSWHFVLFDKKGKYSRVTTIGEFGDFETFEKWMRDNKMYAHNLSSFRFRSEEWYNKSFKGQLKNLTWEFSESGELKNTSW